MRFCAIVLLLSSFSAMAACPNLVGTYKKCVNQADGSIDSTDVVITQAVVNGVMTFTSTDTDADGVRSSSTIVADGVERTETEEEGGIQFSTTSSASCEENALVVSGSAIMNGEEVGSFETVIAKEGSKMISVSNDNLNGEESNTMVVCE